MNNLHLIIICLAILLVSKYAQYIIRHAMFFKTWEKQERRGQESEVSSVGMCSLAFFARSNFEAAVGARCERGWWLARYLLTKTNIIIIR